MCAESVHCFLVIVKKFPLHITVDMIVPDTWTARDS